MGFRLGTERADELLCELKKEYRVFAPKRFEKQGRYSDTDVIRYDEIDSIGEIVTDRKTTYSPKEVILPITQPIMYFTEDEFRESKSDEKKILIFMRPCDINARAVQDRIFVGNGRADLREDFYYKRVRDRVKFVMMECREGWDTCFCVSMGTNRASGYAAAVRFEGDGILLDVCDDDLAAYLRGAPEAPFEPEFVTENETKVELPSIPDKGVLNDVKAHPMWKEYDDRCIGCGACTIACGTCTCFSTTDVFYSDNANVGERRRIYASCQIKGFDEMSGGMTFRNTHGDRMRYKVLHKVRDYKERFGEHMCVGCGRCTDRCPQNISFSHSVNRLSRVVREIVEARAKGGPAKEVKS
jgi:anaerobic sulfite reductase subunit A